MARIEDPIPILARNLQRIEQTISEALAASGRQGKGVQLVVITKGRSPELIRAAYDVGMRSFGENRVAEGLAKQAALTELEGVSWHMVGKIQSRKAKDVAPNFACVHSLDRLKIARLLNQRREGTPGKLQVFIEGNFSGEQTKSGFQLVDRTTWPEVVQQLGEIFRLHRLELIGVMTMAPWQVDQSLVRQVFRKARDFRDILEDEYSIEGLQLSMGMTDDYPIAIEEGATVLRLGRAVFADL
jgi:pyridoxal phosphate enzyme (YggS family)